MLGVNLGVRSGVLRQRYCGALDGNDRSGSLDLHIFFIVQCIEKIFEFTLTTPVYVGYLIVVSGVPGGT